MFDEFEIWGGICEEFECVTSDTHMWCVSDEFENLQEEKPDWDCDENDCDEIVMKTIKKQFLTSEKQNSSTRDGNWQIRSGVKQKSYCLEEHKMWTMLEGGDEVYPAGKDIAGFRMEFLERVYRCGQ